jgi:hypothetical protein
VDDEDSIELLYQRAAAMVQYARRIVDQPANEADVTPQSGPDVETLAELALRDTDKIIKLRSTFVDAYLCQGRALVLLEKFEEAVEVFQTGINFDLQNPELLQELKRTKETREPCFARDGQAVVPFENRAPKRRRPGDAVLEPSADDSSGDAAGSRDDFDCPLCCKLLYEPVTTPCGHTFCRSCLMRVLDHGNRCPMCRVVLHMSARRHPIAVNLQSILTRTFPRQTEERQLETAEEVDHGPSILPLFVVDYVLPGQVLALNIFEPRYRLMVRRCLDGDRRFGMLGSESTTGAPVLGCEMEISDSRQLHDGRYHIQVKALRRFSVMQKWDLDGYRVARVSFFDDSAEHIPASPAAHRLSGPDSEGTPAELELNEAPLELNEAPRELPSPSPPAAVAPRGDRSASAQDDMVKDAATPALSGAAQVASAVAQPQDEISLMVRQVQIMVKEWLVRARTLSRHSPKMSLLFRQLVARAGKPPADPSSAVELYTFWVGNILPTSTSDRQSMLGTISTRGRLRGLGLLLKETLSHTKTDEPAPKVQCPHCGKNSASASHVASCVTAARATAAHAAAAQARHDDVDMTDVAEAETDAPALGVDPHAASH